MIQQISYYISKAGIISAAGKTEDERRRLSDMPTPAAYVSYAPSLPALVGWYGYRVAFNGVGRVQLEAALDSLRRHFRLRDLRVGYDRFNGFYIMEALFAVRMNLPGGVFGGAQPAPELEDYLNFTMPNGGTVTLKRNGSPKLVELEYSLDNQRTWTDWQEVGNVRTLTLTAGKTLWMRNKSETTTGFSINTGAYYQFSFVGVVAASGNCNSLLCKIPNNVIAIPSYCYAMLFYNCTSLKQAPILPANEISPYSYYSMFRGCTSLTLPKEFTLPATTLYNYCYSSMFQGCTSLTLPDGFTLPATMLASYCYSSMFRNCTSLNVLRTLMTDISATSCLSNWVNGVAATGDFYCDQNLTIPTGASGIPSGWTRHDI